MEVFSDKFGRKIWFAVSGDYLSIDLQDLREHSEYERSATVHGLTTLCSLLNCEASTLENVLFKRFGGKAESFDLLTAFLLENNIPCGYYSASR